MSSKYFALLKNKKSNLEYEMAKDSAEKHARYLIQQLNKGSDWLQIDCIKFLKYFTEFDFVKSALIEKYKTTTSLEIQQIIKDIYDNKLDTSEIDHKIKEKILIDSLN
jgi:hypothetical protein